jgi:uncharacterized protein (TIGR03790 family)
MIPRFRLRLLRQLAVSGVFLLVLTTSHTIRAELTPDQVAIVAVQGSPSSREIAQYYAAARKIPESHICLIDVKPGADLARVAWEVEVRPAIRKWLLETDTNNQIRCLVTVWDVPLKIGKEPADVQNARDAYLLAERRGRFRRLLEQFAALAEIAPTDEPVSGEAPGENSSVEELANAMKTALAQVEARIGKISDLEQRKKSINDLMQSINRLGGLRGVLQVWENQLKSGADVTLELTGRVDETRGRLRGLAEGLTALDQLPEAVERDEQILAILEATDGLLGSVAWIDSQRQLRQKNETYASFDSELSLLLWPDYPLNRWQPNYLHYSLDKSPIRERRFTLMVSRLEAPTPELTRRLVDTAIQVEQTGLEGKIYLDARGLAGPQNDRPNQRGSYGEYDQALRDLAGVLQENTDWKITLDNQAALFQDGDCPDTALYCGWYSLAKYVDAFDFRPGAVAYHLASSEATTLRDENSQVWCKRLLEDGVCATIGPVHEPYLAAFPRPDEFFVLLGTGKYSLVETYYRTKTFNSWVMVLVGDPLYRPFAARPLIKLESIPPKYRALVGDES